MLNLNLLKYLESWLDSNGFKKEANQIKALAKLPKFPGGEISSFDWLKDGSLFRKFYQQYPEAYESFIEENSSTLSQFDISKYLGSGMIGDVWLLDDGTVLKIFDAGAEVGKRTDLDKYEELMDLLFEGDADPGDPMIYDVKKFEMTPELWNAKSPVGRRFNWNGYFQPGYAIIEKVESFDSMVKSYTEENLERFEIPYEYDEDGDIVNEPDEEELFRPVTEDISPGINEAFEAEEYAEEVGKFLNSVMNDIIMHFIGACERFKEPDDYYDDEEEGGLDFDNPQDRKNMAVMMVEEIDYGVWIPQRRQLVRWKKCWDYRPIGNIESQKQ